MAAMSIPQLRLNTLSRSPPFRLSSGASSFISGRRVIPIPDSSAGELILPSDHYATLKVSRSATLQEIKASYRNLARKTKTFPGDEKKMIEAIVYVVIERLGELILSEAEFAFSGGVHSLDAARDELRQICCFLKGANERARQGEIMFINHVAEIREAAYDMEDVIATFVLKQALRRLKRTNNSVLRIGFIVPKLTSMYHNFELHKLGSEMERISAKIAKSRKSFQESRLIIPYYKEGQEASSSGHRQRRELRRAYSHTTEEGIVGFEEHIRKLTNHLISMGRQRVFAIYGMGGLGKTTLARKIYQSGTIRHHFDGCAWASISQQCEERDVWEGILIKLTSPTAEERKEMKAKSSEEIARLLYRHLKHKSCLVILDDIWTVSKWLLLKPGFPVKRTSNSRILLTTRKRNVALCAGPRYSSMYELPCLNAQQSWKLFQKKVNFERAAKTNSVNHRKMINLGRKMIKHCAGLPIAIVLLSGLLSSKESLHDWEMLDRNFEVFKLRGKMHLQEESDDLDVSSILGLSYEDLPNHLKLCFVHFAHFPNNAEIMVNGLCQIWVAEGFVSSEDMAYQCLVELVDRSLVQVAKWGSVPGRIKTCTLHDLMRNLCLLNAKKDNFLQTMHISRKDVKTESLAFEKNVVEKHKDRRLAIYLDDANAKLIPPIKSRDSSLRSLLCLHSTNAMLYKKVMKLIFKRFHLLRVLKFDNVDSCQFGEMPKEIGKLIHLRLLSLKNAVVHNLPSSIGNLICLQTLDFRVSCANGVILPNVLWKLGQLRHLYLPRYYEVSGGKLRLDTLSSLRTLVNIRFGSCDWDDVSQLINLTKLRIQTDQHDTNFIKSIVALDKLQSLSLETHFSVMNVIPITSSCPQIYKLLLVGNMRKLPEYKQFPQDLIKLSLERTHLRNDPMATLQKLPNLRMLRLDVDAYVGTTMICFYGGFPQLENLSLSYLYNFKLWTVMGGALQRLRYLKIEGCKSLEKIPPALGYIATLQEIVIQWMPREFKANNPRHGFPNSLKGPSFVFQNWSDSDSGGSTSAVSDVSRGAQSDIEL